MPKTEKPEAAGLLQGEPEYVEEVVSEPEATPAASTITKGSKVRVNIGARWYGGAPVPEWVHGRTWLVADVRGDRVIIGESTTDCIGFLGAMHMDDLTVVE